VIEEKTRILPEGRARLRPDPWSAGAVLIAFLVVVPIAAVVWLALGGTGGGLAHLWATTMPRYVANTALLMAGVGVLAAAVGTGAAWLVVMYRFPLSRWLEWALLLPLAIPAYVGAYALVDFLEYAGPVQTGLRQLFGWQGARDYWFPEIRSMGSAVVVLSAALYPYVYLLARASFREQSAGALEVARSLGAGPTGRFLRVGLPMARPAIAAGVAIVMMETVNDFGTVDYFAVQTLTLGIFSVWLEFHDVAGAAQIASVILGVVLLLVALEKVSRSRSRYYQSARRQAPVSPEHLGGPAGLLATLACLIPFAVGFILPVGVILYHALRNAAVWQNPALYAALANTLTVGGAAAVVTVVAALFMVYGVRLSGKPLPRILLPVTTIGYAAPGAVLAIGILVPLARLDNAVADAVLWLTGRDPGLILTGSAMAIVYAYGVRFFAIAQGAADSGMGRIPPSVPLAARTLGKSPLSVLVRVYVPLMRTSVGTALLLVFVDCVKELPATMLLRPFNFNTLATLVHEQASLENLGDAAPSALLIVLVGLVAVVMLARANRAR